jgi:hypothetical protein
LARRSALFAGDTDYFFEGGQEAGPIVLGPQFAPELFGPHAGDDLTAGRNRQRGRSCWCDLRCCSPDGRLLPLVERLFERGGEPLGDLGGGRHLVIHAGEHRHGFGALLPAADGHHHLFVNAENGLSVLKRFELLAEVFELGEGGIKRASVRPSISGARVSANEG